MCEEGEERVNVQDMQLVQSADTFNHHTWLMP